MNDRVQKVREQLETLQHHLDVTYSLFQVKLLWLNRIRYDNRDYHETVGDPIEPITIEATAEQLRAHYDALLNEIRRTFINDLFLTVARDGVLARNMIVAKHPVLPEFYDKAHDGEIEALYPYLTKDDKRFLKFFRHIRNSTVHYDGNHNCCNKLDYEFNGTHFLTTDENLGSQIGYWLSDLVAIYKKLKMVFTVDSIIKSL